MSEATILSLIQVVIGLLDLAVGFLALKEMSPPKADSHKNNHED